MPNGLKPVWTTGRKLAGNVLPLMFSLPLLVLGIKGYPATGMSGSTLVYLVLFPIVGWIATNFFGPCGSWGLKQVMGKRLHHERPFDKTEKLLVGFARPSYRGLLDPHEDVGFLILHPDRIEFFGGSTTVELSKADIQSVSHRSNPHTWLGLGRWVCVEGQSEGKPFRLLIEPRDRASLIGNLILGSKLRQRILAWLAE